MKYYTVKHLPTDSYMPETNGHYSHWDPVTNKYKDRIYPPRLFLRKQSAVNALTAWLQGIWGKKQYLESEGWEYPSYWVESEPLVIAQPVLNRIKSEMAIVTLELTEYGLSS